MTSQQTRACVIILGAVAATCLLGTGCGTTDGPRSLGATPIYKKDNPRKLLAQRLTWPSDVVNSLEVLSTKLNLTQDGMLAVQARLYNGGKQGYAPIKYRMIWLHDAGKAIPFSDRPWREKPMDAGEAIVVYTVAPVRAAKDFKLEFKAVPKIETDDEEKPAEKE